MEVGFKFCEFFECAGLFLGVEEGIHRLDYGEVRMEVERERPFWGSDEAVSVVVLEDGVLRILQILDAMIGREISISVSNDSIRFD